MRDVSDLRHRRHSTVNLFDSVTKISFIMESGPLLLVPYYFLRSRRPLLSFRLYFYFDHTQIRRYPSDSLPPTLDRLHI